MRCVEEKNLTSGPFSFCLLWWCAYQSIPLQDGFTDTESGYEWVNQTTVIYTRRVTESSGRVANYIQRTKR